MTGPAKIIACCPTVSERVWKGEGRLPVLSGQGSDSRWCFGLQGFWAIMTITWSTVKEAKQC